MSPDVELVSRSSCKSQDKNGRCKRSHWEEVRWDPPTTEPFVERTCQDWRTELKIWPFHWTGFSFRTCADGTLIDTEQKNNVHFRF